MKRQFVFAIVFLFFANLAHSQQVSVFFSLKKDDAKKNHFTWLTYDKRLKDSYDAISGASKHHATKNFSEFVQYEGKRIFPQGLRNLFLFAVSSPEYMKIDDLTFFQEEKKVTIRFIHRGNAYKIETDEKGFIVFDFDEQRRADFKNAHCFTAKKIAENRNGVFTPKDEFLKESTDKDSPDFSDVDWEKIPLEPETFDKDALKAYKGKLKVSVSKDSELKISGTLKQVDILSESDKREKKEEFLDVFKKFKFKKNSEPETASDSAEETSPVEQEPSPPPEEADNSGAEESESTPEKDSSDSEEKKIEELLKKLDSF